MMCAEFIENNPETGPFWRAAAGGRFVLPWCKQCHRTHWYPRAVCPHCLSTAIDWRESSGEGEIYSFAVNRMAKEDSYVLAYVALSEGPIMLGNVIDADPATLWIGKKVKVVLTAVGEAPVPRFAAR